MKNNLMFKICFWVLTPLAIFIFLYGFNNVFIWKWGLWSQDWIITIIIIGGLLIWLLYIRIKKLEELNYNLPDYIDIVEEEK